MEELDLSSPSEPEAVKDQLQEQFRHEIERNQQPSEHPKASNRVEYSNEFRDAVLGEVKPILWDAWQDELDEAGVSKADFEQLAELSTYTGIMWAHGDMEWEYLVDDVRRKVENADQFLRDEDS